MILSNIIITLVVFMIITNNIVDTRRAAFVVDCWTLFDRVLFSMALTACYRTGQKAVGSTSCSRCAVFVITARMDSWLGPNTALTLNRFNGNGTQTSYDKQRQLGQNFNYYGGHQRIGQNHDNGIPHCRLQQPPVSHFLT